MRTTTTTIRTDVTADDLNEILSLDGAPVTLLPDAWHGVTAVSRPDLLTPEAVFDESDPRHLMEVEDWTALHGYSNAYGSAASAVMHPSEYVGGGMAHALIAEAREDGGATYCVAEVEDLDDREALIGWAIFRYEPKEN